MARIRSIHPDACENEKLLMLSDVAERTYWRLLTQSDDEGRGKDSPALLAAKLYPVDPDKDEEVLIDVLGELECAGLLRRYTVGGKAFYEIHDFTDWQKPRHPTPSKIPSPEEADDTPPEPSRSPTAKRRKPHAGVEWSGGGEGEGSAPERREDVDSLCDLLADLLEGNGCRRPSVSKQWRDEARRLLDKDRAERGEAERVMRWALADDFWRSNIMSIPTFRRQYDRLKLQSQRHLRAVSGGDWANTVGNLSQPLEDFL